MREIIVDMDGISDISEIHEYLKNLFMFPGYYGKNLDALYDCLTDISEYTEVTMIAGTFVEKSLSAYGMRIISVFEDAAKHNKNLKLWLRY